MSLEKYVGCMVRIVYVDRENKMTQRLIEVRSVVDGRIRAYCLKSRGPRMFTIENVLAFEPVQSYAG